MAIVLVGLMMTLKKKIPNTTTARTSNLQEGLRPKYMYKFSYKEYDNEKIILQGIEHLLDLFRM